MAYAGYTNGLYTGGICSYQSRERHTCPSISMVLLVMSCYGPYPTTDRERKQGSKEGSRLIEAQGRPRARTGGMSPIAGKNKYTYPYQILYYKYLSVSHISGHITAPLSNISQTTAQPRHLKIIAIFC